MSHKTKLSFLALIAVLTYSCTNHEPENNSVQGIWKSIGYGKILHIDSTSYSYYDITDISCLSSKHGELSELENSMEVSHDTLAIKSGLSVYYYIRTAELPSLCVQSVKDPRDLLYNFEVFSATFKNHYAYFELNKIDWDSLYTATKLEITNQTTEVDLYNIMQRMIDFVHDNHGAIEPSDEVYDLAELVNSEEEESDSMKEYGDFKIAGLVANHFLEEDLTEDSWLLKWGKMKNNVGYIQVKAMWLFAELDLPDSLVKENGFVSSYADALDRLSYAEQAESEVRGIRTLMDKVMNDLRNTDYIILDVRFNGGGQDVVGLEILKRFNQKRRHIASKKARANSGYTKETTIYLEPAEVPYTNPVYLLTSQQSASATDMLALSSMELNQIKRIGSHTNGAISDALEKTLPNGWYFSLSNEVYTDIKGECYENIGIPVDYELNYPKDRQTFFRSVADDLEKDKKDILNAIQELLSKN